MFHRHPHDANAQQQHPRGSFLSRLPWMNRQHAQRPVHPPPSTAYYPESSRSDWDHYAVRHEDALIGDPIPVANFPQATQQDVDRNRNGIPDDLERHNWGNHNGMYPPGMYYANGPKTTPSSLVNRYGTVAPGPVIAMGHQNGNYSSGTFVERDGFNEAVYGPGSRTRGYNESHDGFNAYNTNRYYDDEAYYGDSYGSAPLYGGQSGHRGHRFGSDPLYHHREVRDTATPLLPDNPWTHNELGREFVDAYGTGTLPNRAINRRQTTTQEVVTETSTKTIPLPTTTSVIPPPTSVTVIPVMETVIPTGTQVIEAKEPVITGNVAVQQPTSAVVTEKTTMSWYNGKAVDATRPL